MAKKAKIRRFKDLYYYFREHKKLFSLLERTHDSIPTIVVTRIDEKGKPIMIIEEEPEPHEQKARYVFGGVEVLRSELSIDEDTIKALIKNLLLSPDIFEHPPYM